MFEERHALWWAGVAVAVAGFSVSPARAALAGAWSVDDAMVVAVAAIVGLVVLLALAFATLARLSAQNRVLAQRLALLEELRATTDEGGR